LRACRAPVVAISPIIGGKAVKGPTGKIMAELGLPVGAASVARHYEDILDVFIADEADASEIEGLGIPVRLAHTLMSTIEDRVALARAVLAAACGGLLRGYVGSCSGQGVGSGQGAAGAGVAA
jgi:LPPG:FO 2-phospho-L-lactate transferase